MFAQLTLCLSALVYSLNRIRLERDVLKHLIFKSYVCVQVSGGPTASPLQIENRFWWQDYEWSSLIDTPNHAQTPSEPSSFPCAHPAASKLHAPQSSEHVPPSLITWQPCTYSVHICPPMKHPAISAVPFLCNTCHPWPHPMRH